MILSALLTQVKTELRINDTDRDTWIKSLFVEILGDFTATGLYAELFVANATATLTAATSTFTAPSNLQHLSAIRYSVDSTNYWDLYLWNAQRRQPASGRPKYYRRIGANIGLLPFDLIVATDAVQIDYYSRVIAIGDSAEFPVPALQNAVLKKVIARVSLYDSDKRFQARESLAGQSFASSFGE
jgi:hypothetical protein